MSISGYQFPDIENDKWESNWLIIEGHANLNGRQWTFSDPCMLTSEALYFAGWLERAAAGEPDREEVDFCEPNLQFSVRKDNTLRISFTHESIPPWGEYGLKWNKYGFNVPIGPALVVAATRLRQQLAHFPIRAGRQPMGIRSPVTS
jgi:hypothetical protein